MSMTNRTLFGSICAQQDNLGDIAIRKVFFDSFLKKQTPLVLLTHGMPQTYIDAFKFGGPVTFISNPLLFQFRLITASLLRKADLAYAPGPHELRDSPLALAKTLLMILNIFLIRLSGGRVRTAGRALRGNGRIARRLEQLLVSLCEAYIVRDSLSSGIAQVPLRFAPDLALGLCHKARTNGRKRIACSFRNDTIVSATTFEGIVKSFTNLGFEVVLVSQVQRDDSQHRALAAKFGLRPYLWESKSHTEQQEVVDQVYSSSYAVISNRLHGLIFGINCGALPIEYRFAESDKISSTLSPGFGSYMVLHDASPGAEECRNAIQLDSLEKLSHSFPEATGLARLRVEEALDSLMADRVLTPTA